MTLTEMADRIHIYPVDRRGRSTHCTDKSEMCWCKPELRQPCPESEKFDFCAASCWRCGGTSLIAPYDEERSVLIMHKEYQLPQAAALVGVRAHG